MNRTCRLAASPGFHRRVPLVLARRRTATSTPERCSSRAMTKPSPPLLAAARDDESARGAKRSRRRSPSVPAHSMRTAGDAEILRLASALPISSAVELHPEICSAHDADGDGGESRQDRNGDPPRARLPHRRTSDLAGDMDRRGATGPPLDLDAVPLDQAATQGLGNGLLAAQRPA